MQLSWHYRRFKHNLLSANNKQLPTNIFSLFVTNNINQVLFGFSILLHSLHKKNSVKNQQQPCFLNLKTTDIIFYQIVTCGEPT